MVVSSTVSGLGKSFYIEQESRKNNEVLEKFPITDHFKFKTLS